MASNDSDGKDGRRYGIDDTIRLMRTLPSTNVELVVDVVKKTLESVDVDINEIIDDADKKLVEIEGRISRLDAEIEGLLSKISVRRREISTLEEDHEESTLVKNRLLLARNLDDSREWDYVLDTPSESTSDNPVAAHIVQEAQQAETSVPQKVAAAPKPPGAKKAAATKKAAGPPAVNPTMPGRPVTGPANAVESGTFEAIRIDEVRASKNSGARAKKM